MMIHILSTCIPMDGKPCIPEVFTTMEAAEAAADARLREEWEQHGTQDDDGNLLPYPGDWRTAQEHISACCESDIWGEWELTSHADADPIRDAAPAMLAAMEKIVEQTAPFSSNQHGVLGYVHRIAAPAIAAARGEG